MNPYGQLELARLLLLNRPKRLLLTQFTPLLHKERVKRDQIRIRLETTWYRRCNRWSALICSQEDSGRCAGSLQSKKMDWLPYWLPSGSRHSDYLWRWVKNLSFFLSFFANLDTHTNCSAYILAQNLFWDITFANHLCKQAQSQLPIASR